MTDGIFNDGTRYKTKEDERRELKEAMDKWLKEGNAVTVLKSTPERTLTYRAKASSK